ncbi:MAG TPA: IPT/TIG domain-containing protein [Solirubrobacteraceae bacterium]|nr:IPT/TIG domain-containing protein [Solirubrobacteraceae bacterium]
MGSSLWRGTGSGQGRSSARGYRRGALICVLILAALAVSAAGASAGGPETPTLAALSIMPSSVNTSTSSQVVTVTAEITDSSSGFASGFVVFESPNGEQTTARASLVKRSGTDTDGTYEAKVTFKQFIEAGTWKVSQIYLVDTEGDAVHLASTQLEAMGFPATVHVESVEDNEPPALAGLSIVPATVNTSSSSQTVTVTAHITDNLSGFASGYVVFKSLTTGKQTTARAAFTRISGTETDGTYEAKVTFERFSAPGPWKINTVSLADHAGNEANLTTARLEAKGLPHTVQVEGVEDTEPPVLAGLSISPASVNTSSSAQTVVVTAHITDSLSGFASGGISFESPNGKQLAARASFTRVSGTEANGTYEADVKFGQFSENGPWKVKGVALTDEVGNEAVLSASQLEAKGLPDTVQVEGVQDLEAPVLAGMSLSPATVNTSSSSQTVTVTAHITDNLSGFAVGNVVLESPNGKETTGKGGFTKVSGSETDGTYEAKLTFNQYSDNGAWKVKELNLADALGNEVKLSAAQLAAEGFPETVQVEGTEDTEPPALVGLSLSPSTINTAASSQSVLVTAHITDNLSGFASGNIVFESPTGKQLTGRGNFAKVSGSETDGTYEAEVLFGQSIESGTWKVKAVDLTDNVGNEVALSAIQLQADGFPYTVSDETGYPPTIKRIGPKTGPASGETVVTITGTNFDGATAVDFEGTEATFKVISPTSITATSPAGTAGATVNVTVTTPDGTSAITSKDHFKYKKEKK